MIKLKNVSYQWENGKSALRHIDLAVEEGQFVLLSGRSGSGKSTLGSVINGLIPHYYNGKQEGRVYVDGHDITNMKLDEIGHLVGTVFQDPRSQFFTTTTDEEIAFGLQTICHTSTQIKERVDEVYRELQLEDLRGRSVFELSGGQKQMIAIASVYAMRPKVMILDEPSANLDMQATMVLRRILKKVKESKTTVILIEHRLYYVNDLFDRLILINDGAVDCDMNRKEVMALPRGYWKGQGLRELTLEDCQIKEEVSFASRRTVLRGECLEFTYPYHSRMGCKKVLKGLDFSLHRGTAVGLIGRNGAGKTTFARLLSGIDKAKVGRFLDSKDRPLQEKELTAATYCVFQDPDYQLFARSVMDEMLLGLPVRDKEINQVRAIAILHDLGLERLIDKHPFTLSRGEKQRLTIACGMMKHSELFIYDEPTSGLDRESMMAVSRLIRQQLLQGVTVVIISHDFEFLANTVREVWVMEEGKISKCIEMKQEHVAVILEKMMGGEDFARV